MNIERIEQELTVFNRKYPLEAMEAAVLNQIAITPILLNALDKAFEEKDTLDRDYMLHTFAMFLLAQFKETLAFPKLVKFLEMDEESIDLIISETLTEQYHAILSSTFNGDLQLLKNIIENDEYYLFARGSALSACENLVTVGKISLEDWKTFLLELLTKQNDATFKSFVVEMIENARFYDLIPEVKRAYKLNSVDTEMGSYAGFIDIIFSHNKSKKEYEVTDAIAATRSWHCFEKEETKESKPTMPDFDLRKIQKELYPTATSPSPKVGRNDPCPCGSGKKYKKCCLGKPAVDVLTPYEQALLQFYPKVNKELPDGYLSFYDYFNEEALVLDQFICLGMRKPIPIYPASREEKVETRFKNFKKAYTLFLSKMEEGKFSTFTEFDEKYQVHYHSQQWLEEFERLLLDYEKEDLISEFPSIAETIDKYNNDNMLQQERLLL